MKIQYEAENLDKRETALMVNETLRAREEMEIAKSQMENVVQDFENRLKTVSSDQLNSLIRKSESAISSILEAYCPDYGSSDGERDTGSFTPEVGEQVHLMGLNGKLATVVEAPVDDDTILVLYGKIKIRVKKSDIRAIPRSSRKATTRRSTPRLKQQVPRNREEFSHSFWVEVIFFFFLCLSYFYYFTLQRRDFNLAYQNMLVLVD